MDEPPDPRSSAQQELRESASGHARPTLCSKAETATSAQRPTGGNETGIYDVNLSEHCLPGFS